jgi:outer membrane protein assembly factor BamB
MKATRGVLSVVTLLAIAAGCSGRGPAADGPAERMMSPTDVGPERADVGPTTGDAGGGAMRDANVPDLPGVGGAAGGGGGGGRDLDAGGAAGAGGTAGDASGTGGVSGTGGTAGNGGASGTGGTAGNGGASGTGGAAGNGGASGTGGTAGNGGASGTGGAAGSGGTSSDAGAADSAGADGGVAPPPVDAGADAPQDIGPGADAGDPDVPPPCEPDRSPPAVAFRIDPGHSGYQPDYALVPPLQKAWSYTFPGHLSYPLIADGRVFVTVPLAFPRAGRSVYALSAANGAVLWGPVDFTSTYNTGWLAYDHGTLFLGNSDGFLVSLDPASGGENWHENVAPAGEIAFGIPLAFQGAIYFQGSDNLYALDQRDGHALWSIFTNGAGDPAVSDSAIFSAWACSLARAYDRLTGNRIWTHPTSGCFGTGTTPALAGGRVFVAGQTAKVLDALHGLELANGGFYLPTVHGDRAFTTLGGIVATDVITGNTLWSFAGDVSSMWEPPLAVNGYVYAGSGNGNLWALDEATGQPVWSTSVGAQIGDAPGNSPDPEAMAAGEGLLVVPATNTLMAFRSVTVPAPKTCPPPGCQASGTCGKELGARCASAAECTSGFCADGFCCDSPCRGSCRTCAQPGAEGRCRAVEIGPDPGTCSACRAGACPFPAGQKCTAPADCADGNCVDGYCCNASSCAGCGACNLPGSEGTCMAVPDGRDPRGTCQTNACLFYPNGCGRGLSCNGEWVCGSTPIPCPGMYTCQGSGSSSVCGGGCGSNEGCCTWGTSPLPICLISANVFLACGAHQTRSTSPFAQSMTSELAAPTCTLTADSNYNGPWSGGRGEYAYQFTAPATQNVRIAVTPASGADDLDLWTFPVVDACPNGGCCSQYGQCQGTAHVAPGGTESLTVSVTAGTTYFIFVDTRHTNEPANPLGAQFTIDVTCGVP